MLEISQPVFNAQTAAEGNLFELNEQWFVQFEKEEYCGHDKLMELFEAEREKLSVGFSSPAKDVPDGAPVSLFGEEVGKLLPGFPIVLHGASSVPQEYVQEINSIGGQLPDAIGIPEDQLRKAATMAVCKINIDSYIRLAMTAGIRRVMHEKPGVFDPREYLTVARNEVRKMVSHKIVDVLGSNGTM